nr:MAG TPA: hypothetical protein [Caudoviricetes sp.]
MHFAPYSVCCRFLNNGLYCLNMSMNKRTF